MEHDRFLRFTDKGIYCAVANVYIDPWKPVPRAIITHGHSDHARHGNQHYLCTPLTAAVIKHRLGNDIHIQTASFSQTINIQGVKISFHPAGHIPGSAQIRLEYEGKIWVVSGDYKTEKDYVSEDFELVPCHVFISESTFGLPIYHWKPQKTIFSEIESWYKQNLQSAKTSILLTYSLGKAQRLIQNLNQDIPIYTHGSIENTNEVLRHAGLDLRATIPIQAESNKKVIQNGIILAPPSAPNALWLKNFNRPTVALISGWMTMRKGRRQNSTDYGFALSDHADWDGLNKVIKSTGAEKIYITHGYTSVFCKWLREKGYDADIVNSHFFREENREENSPDNVNALDE